MHNTGNISTFLGLEKDFSLYKVKMNKLLKKASSLFAGPNSQEKKMERRKKAGIVEQTQPEVEHKEEEEEPDMKLKDKGKLFVGGLSQATTSEGLKAYFSLFGNVVDAVVMTFSDSSKSRGYGFVTFANPASADVALQREDHVVDGKAVDIRPFRSNRSRSRARRRNDARVCLQGIPFDMNKEDLRSFFSRYGKITDLVIPHHRKTGKPKGFAFLSFEDKEAAEKCVSEGFVHLGNRRVGIRKATARDGSVGSCCTADVEEGEECTVSDLDVDVDDDSHSSTTSGDRTSLFEQFPGFLNILENYFQSKIAAFNNGTKQERQEVQKWQPSWKDVKEVEKMLASFAVESSGGTSSDEDDQESTYYESDDRETTDEDDSATVEELSSILKEVLKGKTLSANVIKKAAVDQSELLALQKLSMPFTIKDKKGSLVCSLCHWTPPDGSCESFLAHCNTPGHRCKIKDRFASGETQERKPHNQQRQSEKVKKIQTIREDKKLPKKKQTLPDKQQQQQHQQQKKKRQLPGQQEKSENPTQNSKSKRGKPPNLKVQALAKGMVCIQAVSPQELSCKLCNKVIPRAPDFPTLMKNVSAHLQSKKHLNKLAETENSLQNALNNKPEKTTNNNRDENTTRKKAPARKDVPGVEKPGKNPEKTVTSRKGSTGTTPQKNFLCLVCNYFASKVDTFNTHLNSKVHSDSFKKASGKSGDLALNFTLCEGCNSYMYGSLCDINKHNSKCSAKK